MMGPAGARAELLGALIEIEEQFAWVDLDVLQVAVDLEERARVLGDDELVMRARICQAKISLRTGEIATVGRQVREIEQWGVQHNVLPVLARVHLLWANVDRHLGDFAAALEHSLLAVELLEDTATARTRVWHRTKLADALGQFDSMEIARTHYRRAEALAAAEQLAWLRMAVLNNWAYMELRRGFAEAAYEVAQRLQTVAEAAGLELEGADLDTIANIYVANGQFVPAERAVERAMAYDERNNVEEADSRAEYLLTLAVALRGQGEQERAQACLEACQELCVERELGDVLVRLQQEQAEAYAARGDFEAAFHMHREFFRTYQDQHLSLQETQARNRHAIFEVSEARRDAERFREQAHRDPLTGLRNRRFVNEHLPLLMIGPELPLSVAVLDLDHFKRVNDDFSHDIGDGVLVKAAEIMENEAGVDSSAFAARMGGEEFLMVLPGADADEAADRLERVRHAIRAYPWHDIAAGLSVTVSVGVAQADRGVTQAEVLSTADSCLYAAKRGGRDQVVVARPQMPHNAPLS
ncbi:sensor domain-containing diguanylate cyclase [Actinoplanes couchii]|nr:GGDEF domain-containing protein [Actinoplanes couchii]MDR6324077.1 diguanylate cyclase (GGDEF)-like protein [Actinoplanes couchii]